MLPNVVRIPLPLNLGKWKAWISSPQENLLLATGAAIVNVQQMLCSVPPNDWSFSIVLLCLQQLINSII